MAASPFVNSVLVNGAQVASNTHASALPGIYGQIANGGYGGLTQNIGGQGFGPSVDSQNGEGRYSASQLGGGTTGSFQASPAQPGAGGNWWGAYGNPLPLLQLQMQDNAWSRANNLANWQMARDRLLGVSTNYANNAPANGARNLTNSLLANPEALNDRVQAMIQNKAANAIDAQTAAQAQQQANILAANGQMDAGSIAAMQERLGMQNLGARQNTLTQLEIQRANQRNADIQNAIGAGQRQAGMDTGVDMDVARTLIQNLPQYKADDYSGWIAAMMGGGNGMPAAQAQASANPNLLRVPLNSGGPMTAQQAFGGNFSQRGMTANYGMNPSGSAGFGFSGQGPGAGNGMTSTDGWARAIYPNSGAQQYNPTPSQFGTPSGFGSSGQGTSNPYNSLPAGFGQNPYGAFSAYGQGGNFAGGMSNSQFGDVNRAMQQSQNSRFGAPFLPSPFQGGYQQGIPGLYNSGMQGGIPGVMMDRQPQVA